MANPWDRREGETDNMFAAFEIYLYLEPPDDHVVVAYRLWVDNPQAKKATDQFWNWSRTHDWKERRSHFRDAKARARAEGVLGGITEHWQLHARAWEQGHTRLLHLQTRVYVKATEIFNKALDEGNYNMGHGVQMGKLFLEIQKHIKELLETAEANKTYEDIPDEELERAVDAAITQSADEIFEESLAAATEGSTPSTSD